MNASQGRMRWVAAACLALLVGCDDDDGGSRGMCPDGPQSPLGGPCHVDQEGLQCRYGYDPPECGGRTVLCRDSIWIEVEHTDPLPQCFDAGSDVDLDSTGDPP